MNHFCGSIEQDAPMLRKHSGVDQCFDMKERYLMIGGRKAYFCYAGSYANDTLIERLVKCYISAEIRKGDDAVSFATRCSSFGFFKYQSKVEDCVNEIFDGAAALIVDGFTCSITSDAKNIPARSIGEPESDRVLRGSRDGFTEKLIDNTCLIRMRLKTPSLRMKLYPVGDTARCSVVLCYVEGRADGAFVEKLTEKIRSIRTDALSMSQESLAECLVKRKWYNPFPKFRYTERPDAACAMMLEGSIIVLCDNSPQAMILPCSIFDFLQETDDYYFPPLTGSYLRLVRMCVFLLSLFLMPVWFLLIRNPALLPASLSFIMPSAEPAFPIFWQIMLVEFTIDGLKLASMNTPGSLNNSLSVVAGLIIGDFAIEVGWLIPEVILYMSFVAMANFTQPSFELGYAFKFMRIFLLVMISLLNYAGLALGILGIILFITLNNSVSGARSYLYPLIPFNAKALKRLFFRVRLGESRGNTKKSR